MRELIAGRAADTGGWDEEEEEKKRNQTVDLRNRNKIDPEELGEKSISLATGDIMETSGVSGLSDVINDIRPRDEDELQADRTRIEANPLERVSTTDMSQPPALPNPPTGPVQIPAKKFPDAANLPAMIAEPDPDDAPAPPPPPQHGRAPSSVQVSPSMQHAAIRPPEVPTAALRRHSSGGQPIVQQQQAGASQPMMPQQQPMMSHPPMTPQSMPMQPGPGSAPQPIMHLHGSAPQPIQSGPPQSGPYEHVDPMAVMSPVGETYPVVDWAQAAAAPVKVVPPWMLALLFVGAIALALGVTMVIALIIR